MSITMVTQLEDDDRAFLLGLYTDYYALVRKKIYGIIQNNNDVEDLVDDAFVKLIEKTPLLRTLD